MRKLVLFVVVLAGIGFLVQRCFLSQSDAAKAYQEFAEALAHQSYDRAIELSEGQARVNLEKFRDQWKRFGTGATYSVTGTSYKVNSEKKNGNDEVELQMTQVVRVNGGGQESAFGRAAASVHNARLKKGSNGWKVVSYSEKMIE